MNGVWRSLIARTLGVGEVVGLNPATPTKSDPNMTQIFLFRAQNFLQNHENFTGVTNIFTHQIVTKNIKFSSIFLHNLREKTLIFTSKNAILALHENIKNTPFLNDFLACETIIFGAKSTQTARFLGFSQMISVEAKNSFEFFEKIKNPSKNFVFFCDVNFAAKKRVKNSKNLQILPMYFKKLCENLPKIAQKIPEKSILIFTARSQILAVKNLINLKNFTIISLGETVFKSAQNLGVSTVLAPKHDFLECVKIAKILTKSAPRS